MNSKEKVINLIKGKYREEIKKQLIEEMVPHLRKEIELVADILIDNVEKKLFMCYSEKVLRKEIEEFLDCCERGKGIDENYCKLHGDQRDPENIILPQTKFRIFEFRKNKDGIWGYYSLISGLRYPDNKLQDDCELEIMNLGKPFLN